MFSDFDHLATLLRGSWVRQPSPDDEMPAGVAIDSRDDLTGKLFVALQGERFDGHDFLDEAVTRGAVMAIVDRDVDAHNLEIPILRTRKTRLSLGMMASAYRREQLVHTCVIAITGSCGKTTTKALVHAALRASLTGYVAPKSFNNEIGVPLTLLATTPTDEYVVVEVGTNAPGEIASLARVASPDISIVTMVGSAHLEGFGSLEAIRREKLALISQTKDSGRAFVNQSVTINRAGSHPPITSFGTSADADIRCESTTWDGTCTTLDLGDGSRFRIPLPGEHNAINALPAIGVARYLGCEDDAIRAGLLTAASPAMRFERRIINGITIINDAYNANPQSMRASIDTFMQVTCEADRQCLVLGDMRELGNFAHDEHCALLHWITGRYNNAVDCLVLIGPSMARAAMEVDVGILCIPTDACAEAAIAAILGRITPGDALLLKGSRSMQLERILEALERSVPAGAA